MVLSPKLEKSWMNNPKSFLKGMIEIDGQEYVCSTINRDIDFLYINFDDKEVFEFLRKQLYNTKQHTLKFGMSEYHIQYAGMKTEEWDNSVPEFINKYTIVVRYVHNK